jgi:hypothetical protein
LAVGATLGESAAAHSGADKAADALTWFDTTASAVTAGGSSNRLINNRIWAIAWTSAARAIRCAPYNNRENYIRAALASAVHNALSALTTGQHANLDAAFQTSLRAIPKGVAKNAGIAAGTRQAQALLSERKGDGLEPESMNPDIAVPAPGPGIWRPTPPSHSRPQGAGAGYATPFALESAAQFRPAGPPHMDSSVYRAELEEVAAYGRIDSTARTADQTASAEFWFGSAAGILDQALRVGVGRTKTLTGRVEMVAQFHLAQVDAQIATADAKYHYWHWRPITAIHNDAIAPDPTWAPLHTTPAHPDYVSGTSNYSGVATTILEELAPRGPGGTFQLTSPSAPDAPRSYATWSDLADEAVGARVWSGIHFRSADVDAVALGADIARYVIQQADSIFG